MKKALFGLAFFFFSYGIQAQTVEDQIQDLVREGIKLHDAGDYRSAIEKYKNAFQLDPESSLVDYEISLSYMSLELYDSAIYHASRIMPRNDRFGQAAYVVMGNSLDITGESEKAVTIYREGIEKLGGSNMLHYNLGLTLYGMDRLEESEEALVKSIESNPNHGSSHSLLASVMSEKGRPTQSLLPAFYFILLEGATSRSQDALKLINDTFQNRVSKTGENDLTITLDPKSASDKKDPFKSVDLMVAFIESSRSLEENKSLTPEEFFVHRARLFFQILSETQKKKYKGLWWELYVPFFTRLVQSDHLEAYGYFVQSAGGSEEAQQWISQNEEKLNAFADWLGE